MEEIANFWTGITTSIKEWDTTRCVYSADVFIWTFGMVFLSQWSFLCELAGINEHMGSWLDLWIGSWIIVVALPLFISCWRWKVYLQLHTTQCCMLVFFWWIIKLQYFISSSYTLIQYHSTSTRTNSLPLWFTHLCVHPTPAFWFVLCKHFPLISQVAPHFITKLTSGSEIVLKSQFKVCGRFRRWTCNIPCHEI